MSWNARNPHLCQAAKTPSGLADHTELGRSGAPPAAILLTSLPTITAALRAAASGKSVTFCDSLPGSDTSARPREVFSLPSADVTSSDMRALLIGSGPAAPVPRGISTRQVRDGWAGAHGPRGRWLDGAAPPYWCAVRGRRPDRSSTACSILTTSCSTSSMYNRPATT